MNTIEREKRKESFTNIKNSIINDTELIDSLGLLIYLLSKPDNWKIREADIKKRFKIGRDKYRRLMREMESAGYAWLIQGGKESGSKWKISEQKRRLTENKALDNESHRLKNRQSPKPTVAKSTPLVSTDKEIVSTEEEIVNTHARENLIFKISDFEKCFAMEKSSFRVNNLWSLLDQNDKALISEHLPKYILFTPNERFMKSPESYLRSKAWTEKLIDRRENSSRVQQVNVSNQSSDISKKATLSEVEKAALQKQIEDFKQKMRATS